MANPAWCTHTNRDVPKEVKNAVGSVLPAYLHKVLATKNAQFREGNAPAAQRRKESGANGRKAYVAEAEKEQGPEVNSSCHEVVDEHMSSDEEDVFPARRVCAMADMSAVVGGGGKNIMISETRSSSTQTDTECGEDVSGAGPSCDRLNCAQTTVMPEDDRQACATGAGPSCDRVLGGLMPKVHPTPTHNEFMTHDYGDVTKCEDQCGNATRGDVIASGVYRTHISLPELDILQPKSESSGQISHEYLSYNKPRPKCDGLIVAEPDNLLGRLPTYVHNLKA